MTSVAAPVSVVLADDSMTIRAMLSALLRDHDDIDLLGVADSGEAAIEVVLERRPDIVIMDMQMPGIGGLAATQHILEKWPEACIVLNTAYSDASVKDQAEELGAAGYITKGQRPSELIETVIDVARRAR